jgi:hypothetical protein
MFIPARSGASPDGDRIGPPPTTRGGLRRLPTRVHAETETGDEISRSTAFLLAPPPGFLGEGRGILGVPRPPASGRDRTAATPHVRGAILFDNPVSAVVKSSNQQVLGSGQYSSPNAGRTRSTRIGDRRYLDAVGERRETRPAAGETRPWRVAAEDLGPSGRGSEAASGRRGQAPKGTGGMPRRHQQSGRGRLRNARGSCPTSVDPAMPSETRGTETSQYPEEKKATAIPLVAASERGPA